MPESDSNKASRLFLSRSFVVYVMGGVTEIFFKEQGAFALAAGSGECDFFKGNVVSEVLFYIGHHISKGGKVRGFLVSNFCPCIQVCIYSFIPGLRASGVGISCWPESILSGSMRNMPDV